MLGEGNHGSQRTWVHVFGCLVMPVMLIPFVVKLQLQQHVQGPARMWPRTELEGVGGSLKSQVEAKPQKALCIVLSCLSFILWCFRSVRVLSQSEKGLSGFEME